jgi:hypothetical protein
MVELVGLLPVTNHEAIVPATRGDVLETTPVLVLPSGLFRLILTPTLDAVHHDRTVVREATLHSLLDRAVERVRRDCLVVVRQSPAG